ncbi:MAG TPA: response regulator [Syntrophales bacterium]|nr:response regulator [Syntrophales bacterium]
MADRQKILVVDDKEENLLATSMLLRESGAEIVGATCGNDALIASLNHDFSLAVLDVQMPEMDGYELAQYLRGEEKTKNVPIIFLSAAYSDEYHVFKGYESGAVDFITKPFNPAIFLSKVNILLQRERLLQDLKREMKERKEAEKAIKEREEELAAIYENAPLLMLLVDRERRVCKANKFVQTLVAADNPVGRLAGEALSCRHALEDPQGCGFGSACQQCAVRRTIADTFESRCGREQVEANLLLSVRGKAQEVTGLVSTVRFHVREEPLVLVTIQDITERKKMERDLQRHASQLEYANRELESFSYSVSHDLRAPLRAIDGYTRMILKKAGDRFDEDTLKKFSAIRDNARMMGQLIEDLLAFSRLGRTPLSTAELDMDALVAEVWGELQVVNPGRRIDFRAALLPAGRADRALIKQVFVNVLSNAVKFTKARGDGALVEVGGHRDGSEIVYFVRDNGVGFDMTYHDKMFGVFQRLHGSEEYEGTGIGLALVQRIVYRHGGRIWAEGKVDGGATFYFTLPTDKV